MSRLKDETGNLYGKWTVLKKDPNKNSSGEVCWICKCQCGNIKSVSGKVLRRGKSKSCGLCNKKIIQIGDKFEDLTIIKKEMFKTLIEIGFVNVLVEKLFLLEGPI